MFKKQEVETNEMQRIPRQLTITVVVEEKHQGTLQQVGQ